MDSACARPNGSHGYRYLRNDVVGFGGGGGLQTRISNVTDFTISMIA